MALALGFTLTLFIRKCLQTHATVKHNAFSQHEEHSEIATINHLKALPRQQNLLLNHQLPRYEQLPKIDIINWKSKWISR